MPTVVVGSQFFLHAERWRVLVTDVLPIFLTADRAPRVWSAGCHTGQEAYSVAILLDEAGRLDDSDVLATDKDPDLVSRAAAGGPFSDPDVRQLSPSRSLRYLEP